MKKIDQECINAIRVLGAECITKAKSGHPGIVLGAAPILHTLFTREINIDSNESKWFDRDRFILSAGHGSMLLYIMLHLSGFKISMDDLMNFRQKGSLTPGHPELGHTDGIDMSTGPLGQGIASAVGMAISEAFLASKFNKLDSKIVNHYTYALCGDGDLEEGVAMEAMSLAGHLKLGKLIVLFDSNDIQLDGEVKFCNSDSVKNKALAMNWNYILVNDGNDCDEIEAAISQAKESNNRPTLIEIKTVIGYGAPNSGENSVHGKPLSQEDIEALRENLGYDYPSFVIPPSVYEFYKENVIERGILADTQWNTELKNYSEKYHNEYEVFQNYIYNSFSIDDYEDMPSWEVGSKESTRKVMGKVLDWISTKLPNIMGGSADLCSSTMVRGANGVFDYDNRQGRNILFGVREHAMAAICNGITAHGGTKGFGSGFFVFSDYMKPAIRLAAISNIPSVFLFSHDSVCVGEDGPSHQPIEQLAMFRAMPNCNLFRPADAVEMTSAMLLAFEETKRPTIVVSTRQPVLNLDCTNYEGVKAGGYIAFEPKVSPNAIMISCGSELSLCIDVAKKLESEGEFVRVVSMPSMCLFDEQSPEYKEMVLPKRITKRLAVEMGATMPWYKYAANVYGIDEFGKSMPLKEIIPYYGFTVNNIYEVYKNIK